MELGDCRRGGEPLPRSPPLLHTRLPLQLTLFFLVKLCQLCLSLCMADCFLHIIHKNNYQSIRRKSMSKCQMFPSTPREGDVSYILSIAISRSVLKNLFELSRQKLVQWQMYSNYFSIFTNLTVDDRNRSLSHQGTPCYHIERLFFFDCERKLFVGKSDASGALKDPGRTSAMLFTLYGSTLS